MKKQCQKTSHFKPMDIMDYECQLAMMQALEQQAERTSKALSKVKRFHTAIKKLQLMKAI